MSDYLEPFSQIVWDITTPPNSSFEIPDTDRDTQETLRNLESSQEAQDNFHSSLFPSRPRTPTQDQESTFDGGELPQLFRDSQENQESQEDSGVRRYLNRDDRIRVQTLQQIGWKYKKIHEFLGFSYWQIYYACRHPLTPQIGLRKPKPKINTPRRRQLLRWLQESPSNRIRRWDEIPQLLDLGIEYGTDAVTTALRIEGQSRYVSRRRPPKTAKNCTDRFNWTQEKVDWTKEQWEKILWSDETWVTGGVHRRVWVTRGADEAYDEASVTTVLRQKKGWMFWGCFAGGKKGPGIFWEKEWGKVTASAYQEHIIPVVDAWMQENASLGWTFMQDNAPAHKAYSTLAELDVRGIQCMDWPAFSPDLNPIEHVWAWMKDYLQNNFSEQCSLPELRRRVQSAWEAVPEDFLLKLVHSMPERVRWVHMTGGGHTRYQFICSLLSVL